MQERLFLAHTYSDSAHSRHICSIIASSIVQWLESLFNVDFIATATEQQQAVGDGGKEGQNEEKEKGDDEGKQGGGHGIANDDADGFDGEKYPQLLAAKHSGVRITPAVCRLCLCLYLCLCVCLFVCPPVRLKPHFIYLLPPSLPLPHCGRC